MTTSADTYPDLSDASLRRRWLLYGGGGLALVGAGFSVAADAGARRGEGVAGARWVGQGTLGLSLLGAGLSVFGEAILLRGELRRRRLL